MYKASTGLGWAPLHPQAVCVRLPHSQKACGVLGTMLGLPGPTSRAHKGL